MDNELEGLIYTYFFAIMFQVLYPQKDYPLFDNHIWGKRWVLAINCPSQFLL